MRLEKGLRVNADREGEATIRWLENGSRKKKQKKNSVLTGHCSNSAFIFPQNERKTVISTFTLSFRKYCKDFE